MILISSPHWKRLSATVLQVVNHHHPSKQTTRHIVRAVSPRLIEQSTSTSSKTLRVSPAIIQVSHRGKRYEPNRDSDFKEIYRFRHVRLTRLISNLKVYQTALTVLAAPFTTYLQLCGFITPVDNGIFLCITSFACLMLYIMSDFFRRIICVMYFNEKKETVELSHLTFWGRRNDVRVDLKDIVDLSDTGEKTNSFYVHVQTYSTGQKYYLFLNHGNIKEIDSLNRIVGLKI